MVGAKLVNVDQFFQGTPAKARSDVGFDDIGLIEFEDITGNRLAADQIVPGATAALNIGVSNVGQESQDGRKLESISMVDAGRFPVVLKLADTLGIRRNANFRKIVARLKNIRLRKGGTRSLVVPQAISTKLRSSLEEARRLYPRDGNRP